MMSTRRLILFRLLILACGFAAGLVITGRMHEATNDAAAQIGAPAPGAGGAAPLPALSTWAPRPTRAQARSSIRTS